MILKRKAMEQFRAWKQEGANHALLVTGARQVGKSFLLAEFTRSNYKNVVSFDLIREQQASAAFANATGPEDLLYRISMLASAPMEPGETVIFIDEVQKCPEIVTQIKYLVGKGDFDYVLSGSLLGVELEDISSFPVGYVTEIQMYPLDFEEYCWAHGCGAGVRGELEQCLLAEQPVPDYLHQRLLGLFHRYLIEGGMPDAVKTALRAGQVGPVRKVQEDIRHQYRQDISQYAPKDRKLAIRNIFDRIPSQLAQQNRRFVYSALDGITRGKQVEEEFLWLEAAGVAHAAYNVVAPTYPLVPNEQRRLVKLFSNDVGLLTGAYLKTDAMGLLDGKPKANMGGVYENAVAQELVAHGYRPFYFTKKNLGELDILIQDNAGVISAFEIKSGTGYKTHASLDKALGVRDYGISRAYVLAECNVERVDDVLYLPIYLIGLFQNN